MTKRILTAAAIATALTFGAAGAQAMDDAAMGQGFNMLTGAVYNALRGGGFDTDNIDNLTLSQIAQIRTLLSDEMGTNERGQIERILESAGS